MAAKHIYLVRHGETADNRRWIHQLLDVSLSAKGKRQADALVGAFAAIPLDAAITSDAVRAVETAQPTVSAHKLAPVPNPLLRELHRGVLLEGTHHLSWPSIKGSLLLFLRASDRSFHFGNGENILEFRDRLARILDLLARAPGEQVFVVTHRGVINSLRYVLAHGSTPSPRRFALAAVLGHTENASITELTYDPSRTAPWRIERRDDTRHLRGL
ncbi:phosphoglycerate mutase family protein [Patescibacteria group bacterium]|nr:phosphoglycerate mutase family protein [Patescibacteria group bacterium]